MSLEDMACLLIEEIPGNSSSFFIPGVHYTKLLIRSAILLSFRSQSVFP
jgi:hypothetical protein